MRRKTKQKCSGYLKRRFLFDMPKLPRVSAQEAVRVLEKNGLVVIRQGKHIIMSDGMVRLVIPRANPINAYTMGTIARDAGLSPEEFRSML